MNNKTLSIVSYITIIGWLVSFFSGKDKADDLLKYHLRQSFGLFVVAFLFNIIITVVIRLVPALSLLSLIGFVFLALLVIGIINAANGVKKPLPIIGTWAEKQFGFIG